MPVCTFLPQQNWSLKQWLTSHTWLTAFEQLNMRCTCINEGFTSDWQKINKQSNHIIPHHITASVLFQCFDALTQLNQLAFAGTHAQPFCLTVNSFNLLHKMLSRTTYVSKAQALGFFARKLTCGIPHGSCPKLKELFKLQDNHFAPKTKRYCEELSWQIEPWFPRFSLTKH